jgi:two-component system chemotaxis sensor kinase CheA
LGSDAVNFDEDAELLQDFLIESDELLENVQGQLVSLEQSPEDPDALNAIFRGFHTIKGGAGFLQIEALVACCHTAEEVFDVLRNGLRRVTPDLMDTVLETVDVVQRMLSALRDGEAPEPATPDLLARLEVLARPEGEAGEDAPAALPDEPVEAAPAARAASAASDPVEAAEGPGASAEAEAETGTEAGTEAGTEDSSEADAPATAAAVGDDAAADDEITEDEFEALLDRLHGKGGAPGAGEGAAAPADESAPASASDSSGDLISDDEFEALLDRMHGSGKGPTAGGAPPAVGEAPAPTAPAPVAAVVAPAPARADAPARRDGPAEAQKTQSESSVRVDTQRLDQIMNMVGELVLVRNRLVRIGLTQHDEELAKTIANLDVVTGDLQASVMKTRMQPIKKVFGRFPRVVRDLARSLKKEVVLQMQGEETDLDKNLVEALADPLVHLVRNAADHGIESPEEREKAGKDRAGTILLTAQQEGDHILLTISDDGRGMDPDKLRQKVVAKGLYDQESAERLTDAECFNVIFMPGFSTKDEISDVSGRGVGMDVVKTRIAQLNGSIHVDSVLGRGTEIAIKVPLTLAIMPTLMIMLGAQTFALPLVNVNEIFNLNLSDTHIVDGQEVVTVRGKSVPLYYLKRWLTSEPVSEGDEGHVVIVTVGTQRVGFVVDQLIGQEEVVIKPLGTMLQGTPGMAGATITGDGSIALILDVPGILRRYG